MNDLKTYMLQTSKLLQDEYNRIQSRVTEDPGTAGDSGEENWAELFRKWLPNKYHVVTKGRIMNVNGDCSPQIDILILSPNYPPLLLNKKEYLAGGVIAAFECKLTLRVEHIYKSIETAKIISNLFSSINIEDEITPYKILFSDITYGLISHSHAWKKSTKIFNTIDGAINRGVEKADIKHPREIIDLICIADLCTWGVMKLVEFKDINNNGDSKNPITRDFAMIALHHYKGDYWGDDEYKKNSLGFTPLGVLMSKLLRRLAWNDKSLRSIASYFERVEMEGTGMGGISKLFELNKVFDPKTIEKQKKYYEDYKYSFPWSEWEKIFR